MALQERHFATMNLAFSEIKLLPSENIMSITTKCIFNEKYSSMSLLFSFTGKSLNDTFVCAVQCKHYDFQSNESIGALLKGRF